ncbi:MULTISPECIES: hypothetical protein [unclassified Paenibacillus]|nr:MULTISPECIES: hypothetical protein [unclassified Paenibacillus]
MMSLLESGTLFLTLGIFLYGILFFSFFREKNNQKISKGILFFRNNFVRVIAGLSLFTIIELTTRNIHHILFAFLTVVLPVAVLNLVAALKMDKLTEGEVNDYRVGYLQNNWSDKSYKYLQSKDWDSTVFKKVQESGALKLSTDEANPSVIVSVSANRAQHELSLFHRLKGNYNVKLICMDANNAKDQIDEVDQDSRFIYLDGDRDAFNLPAILDEIQIGQVDIILDKKGALWHNSKKVDTFFEIAYNKLSPGGVVIIDGSQQNKVLTKLSFLYYQLFRTIIYPTELSTLSKIEGAIGSGSFAVRHFERIDAGEGIFRTVIFKKKH